MPHYDITIRVPVKDQREAEELGERLVLLADDHLHAPGFKPAIVALGPAPGQAR
jgi:hypothetical protein